MRHILSLLMENEAGALSRVSGLFSARAFNIESLIVAPTEDSTVSRMTVVTSGSDAIIEQITKQLNKLVDVIKVVDLNEFRHIERELMLIKVKIIKENRSEILELAKIFRAKVVDISLNSVTFEIAGDAGKIITFQQLLENFEVLEIVRSGKIALERDLGLNTEILKKI
mgnify:CR=1 FL=1